MKSKLNQLYSELAIDTTKIFLCDNMQCIHASMLHLHAFRVYASMSTLKYIFMSMLLVVAAGPLCISICMSILYSIPTCPRFLSILHVHALLSVSPRCMSMPQCLCLRAAGPCCIFMLHVMIRVCTAYQCCTPTLYCRYGCEVYSAPEYLLYYNLFWYVLSLLSLLLNYSPFESM